MEWHRRKNMKDYISHILGPVSNADVSDAHQLLSIEQVEISLAVLGSNLVPGVLFVCELVMMVRLDVQ